MAIDAKARRRLIEVLKGTDYRKVVSVRAKVHRNTVTNVLMKPTNSLEAARVEAELLIYAKEVLELRNSPRHKEAAQIARQL